MRACRDLREIPGVRNCGSHIGQALLSDEIYGVYFGENWISVDENVDYDEDAGLHRPDGRGLSRALPRRADLPARAHQGGPDRDQRVDRRADLRARPRRSCARRRTRSRARSPGSTGVIDAHPDFAEDLPTFEVEVDLAAARRYGLKPGDVRRQSSTLLASEEVSDLFIGGKAYDVHVWSIPSARDSLTDVERLPIDTPTAARAPGAGRRRAHRPDAEPHRARAAVAPDRRGRQRGGARPRLGRRRRRGAPRRQVEVPARVPRRGAGRVHRAQRRSGPPAARSGSPPRSRSSCCCRRPSAACAWRR